MLEGLRVLVRNPSRKMSHECQRGYGDVDCVDTLGLWNAWALEGWQEMREEVKKEPECVLPPHAPQRLLFRRRGGYYAGLPLERCPHKLAPAFPIFSVKTIRHTAVTHFLQRCVLLRK